MRYTSSKETKLERQVEESSFNAQYSNERVIVYQAYSDLIANELLFGKNLGQYFSFNRTSWIKTSFLWMMNRSDWSNKKGQERILRISLERDFFNSLLKIAVSTTYNPRKYNSIDQWREDLNNSEAIYQMDPDRDLFGIRQKRKAIQLGLRGSILKKCFNEKILAMEDITNFVKDQHLNLELGREELVQLPVELPYPLSPSK